MWRSPTEIRTRTMVDGSSCSKCGEEVRNDDRALLCELCEMWEHQYCVREEDRLTEELYSSKSIVYVCRACRNKGSLGKRLFKLELECARANEQRLASERLLEERQRLIESLLGDKQRLTREREAILHKSETSPVQQQSSVQANERASVTQSQESNVVLQSTSDVRSDDHFSESEHEDGGTSQDQRPQARNHRRLVQPLGFNEIRSRVGKFSGRKGDEDFGLWLADFEEATDDFTWSSETRAKWFSWFVEGPAKATWQRTLSVEERGSWACIKKIFQGQYGTHMDPRTAYLRCHELQYEELGSVQALLEAMREYQRLAPDKLSDTNLESILWNKVPVTLQKEVGEMKEWSLQELFQRLLKAEARVQERERRQQLACAMQPGSSLSEEMKRGPIDGKKRVLPAQTRSTSYKPPESTPSKSKVHRDKPTGEMQAKHIKCFNCNEKGHFASSCPKAKVTTKGSLRVHVGDKEEITSETQTSENQTTSEDITLWTRVLTLKQFDEQQQPRTHTVGPSYKINVTVAGIPTRAFLDHGSQVTIIRRQVLPLIRDKQGWSDEQCIAKTNCKKMGAQPVGAKGKELGTCGIVVLQMEIDETGQNLEIPCYVLDSVKPLWQGELKDCAVLLGTNALTDFGFEVVHSNGIPIYPVYKDQADNFKEEKGSLKIVLKKSIHLKPGCTKLAQATVEGESGTPPQANWCGIMTPNAEVLVTNQCDFQEELWNGQKDVVLSLTNWSNMPVLVKKQCQVGKIDHAEFVAQDDPHWKVESKANVRVCQVNSEDRNEHLRNQLKIGDAVNEAKKKELVELLLQFGEAFALTDEDLGETSIVEHTIDTKGAPPVSTCPRRIPYVLREELERELENLQKSGCVEESNSPYASALVLVRKKGGGLRICVDYRALNKDTVPDKYPIPRIDELIDRVGSCKAKVFSALDLMKGYHQVKVRDEDKQKTAFVCHQGLYQYRRMPFGLTNAPATFQRLIDKLFDRKKWPFVFTYLDDILIASASIEEHFEHVSAVLTKLTEVGLRLRPEKCCFARTEIEYLGHTLTPSGVKPNNAKVKAVQEFPQPKSAQEIKSFLGLVNFYRSHVQDLGVLARPLTELTRTNKTTGKTVVFQWSEECQKAFQEIKNRLSNAPVLQPPDLTKPFFLWVDASTAGFGAVLEQETDDGKTAPVAFASRPTSSAEQKFAATELEVAGLVFALEHFEVYVLGNQVTVYTDHQALVKSYLPYLKSQTKGLLARWYLRLARFLPTVKLEYKPGRANAVADALSRAPVGEPEVYMVVVSSEQDPLIKRIQEQQSSDLEVKQLLNYVGKNILPDDDTAAKRVVSQGHRGYYVVDGVLYHEDAMMPSRRRLVVPTQLRDQVLAENHDTLYAGHFSAKKMYDKVSQYYFWPGMKGDVYKKCSNCVTCASVQGQGRRHNPPLKSIPVGEPFECIGMDFKEFDVSRKGNRYALVFQDYLTKWPEVFAVPDRTATTVAHCLAEVIWRHGVPRKIIHDRAAEFLSDVLQDTASIMGLIQLPTSGGHPQTDGLVERLNRTLKAMLSKVVSKGGKDWDECLGPALLAYRTAPQASTSQSPFFLMYGRDARMPTGLNFYTPAISCPTVESEYARQLFKELKNARMLAKKYIQSAQRTQKRQYDKRAQDTKICAGDLVMLKVEPRFRLDRGFKGPYRVQEVTTTNATIQMMNEPNSEPLVVSLQRLSLCNGSFSDGAQPWKGHYKPRRRRQVRRSLPKNSQVAEVSDYQNSATRDQETRTRTGRVVKRPVRYCLTVESSSSQGEGRCKGQDHERDGT